MPPPRPARLPFPALSEPLFFSFTLGFLLLCGVFSAATTALETAFLTFGAEGRRALRRSHPAMAKRLEQTEEQNPHAAACLSLADGMWNTLFLFAAVTLWRQLPPEGAPLGWFSLAVILGLLVVFCELLPKLLGWHWPLLVLRAGLPLFLLSVKLGAPVVGRLRAWTIRWSPGSLGKPESHTIKVEELRENFLELVELAVAEGPLEEGEARALREIVRLGQAEATHLMTPRVECFLLPANLSEEEARTILRRERKHWVPVFNQTRDEILGILNVEDYFLHPGPPYPERLLSPSFVPESMNALRLLSGFLSRRQKMALLLDEYGGFEGLVTLSDAMEEVFGIEGPGLGSGIYLENIGPGRFLAGGHVRLDDLCEALHTSPPESEAETIAGWLSARHGTIPRVGETFAFGPWQITVRRASRKRIKEVLVEALPQEEKGVAA